MVPLIWLRASSATSFYVSMCARKSGNRLLFDTFPPLPHVLKTALNLGASLTLESNGIVHTFQPLGANDKKACPRSDSIPVGHRAPEYVALSAGGHGRGAE